MSNDNQTDSPINSSVSNVSEKRRKLLKASAATPLVATLTLGAGQAAANSAFQCMSNNTNPPANKFISSDDGEFVRMEATRYTKVATATEPSRIVYQIPRSMGNFYEEGATDPLGLGFDVTDYESLDGYVLNLYRPEEVDQLGLPTKARDVGPWPQFQIGVDNNQPLYQSCETSIPIVTTGINKIKGNIV